MVRLQDFDLVLQLAPRNLTAKIVAACHSPLSMVYHLSVILKKIALQVCIERLKNLKKVETM